MLVRLRSDKRFDHLVDRQAEQFDVERATSRRVDEARVQVILHPDRLEYIVALMRAMLADGMNEAVLDVTGRVLAAIAAAPDAPPFVDTGAQTAWLMNLRSTALFRLGRTDEALAALEQSAKPVADGSANVNQVLNLAYFYCGLGHAEDARATAARAGSTINDYG
jgi:tetratricopeptide (TPR) repeat protein